MLDAREHVELLASGVKRHDSRTPPGVKYDIPPMRDFLFIEAPKPSAAVRGIAAGMVRLQLPIEPDELKLMPIFPDQGALTGGQIKQKSIMPTRVAIVEAYRDFIGDNV